VPAKGAKDGVLAGSVAAQNVLDEGDVTLRQGARREASWLRRAFKQRLNGYGKVREDAFQLVGDAAGVS